MFQTNRKTKPRRHRKNKKTLQNIITTYTNPSQRLPTATFLVPLGVIGAHRVVDARSGSGPLGELWFLVTRLFVEIEYKFLYFSELLNLYLESVWKEGRIAKATRTVLWQQTAATRLQGEAVSVVIRKDVPHHLSCRACPLQGVQCRCRNTARRRWLST